MKLVTVSNRDKIEKISVYTNYEKKSNHIGDIVCLKSIGWGLLACGDEQFITSKELKQIREKVDELNGD